MPDVKGADIVWTTLSVTLPANASVILAHLDAPAGTIPCAMLSDAQGNIISRRRWVDRPYNELGLLPADIHVTIENGVATYTSDTLVLGVCLDLDGDDANLSDNFFDLFPGVSYSVQLGGKSGAVLYHL